jgi:hypothetical protein
VICTVTGTGLTIPASGSQAVGSISFSGGTAAFSGVWT